MQHEDIYRLFVENGQTVTTDSRVCPAGAIFFALKGEKFNGNRFAAKALENGCSYAVVDEAEYCDRVSIMVDGKIEALDSPRALREQFRAENMDDVFQQLARKAKRTSD